MSPHDSRDAQSISMGGEMSVCGGSAGLPNESTLYSAWYSESSEKGNFYQQIYHVFDVMIIKPSCESPAVPRTAARYRRIFETGHFVYESVREHDSLSETRSSLRVRPE